MRTVPLLCVLLAGCGGEPPGPPWEYPPGDAKATFEKIPLDELMARWQRPPKSRSQYSLHGTYAEAIGMHGEKAARAVPLLEPYVLDEKEQYLRQAAMKGLAGIGSAGAPALAKALRHKAGDPSQVMLRWDAAMAMAKMGPAAAGAAAELEACLTDPKENVNTKGDAAVALAGIGAPAREALARVKDWFYARKGLSPSETAVLRTINQGLAAIR